MNSAIVVLRVVEEALGVILEAARPVVMMLVIRIGKTIWYMNVCLCVLDFVSCWPLSLFLVEREIRKRFTIRTVKCVLVTIP